MKAKVVLITGTDKLPEATKEDVAEFTEVVRASWEDVVKLCSTEICWCRVDSVEAIEP